MDRKVQEAFYLLEKGDQADRSLFISINKALDTIEHNTFSGTQIPKRLIPHCYLKLYGVKNLWKYNLPKGWRLVYSISSDGILVISIILEWFDHKEYERRFNY